MSDYRKNLGRSGEDEAAAYLEAKGFQIIERNFRAERGEIDIIARDGDVVVFVEVKTRRKEGFGDPESWVGRRKQAQIGKVALAFLQREDLLDTDCRFDVIAVDRSRPDNRLRHIEDAFWMDAE